MDIDIEEFDYLGKHILTVPSKRPPATFLSLPDELRYYIYECYFQQSFGVPRVTSNHFTTPSSISTRSNLPSTVSSISSPSEYNSRIQVLFTSHLIYNEASQIFYKHHFTHICFQPTTPRTAYSLITSLAHHHPNDCYGEISVHPNPHTTGLNIVSGYRNLELEDLGYFLSVEFLELGLRNCDMADLIWTGSSKGKTNSEVYMCAMGWHLRVLPNTTAAESAMEYLPETVVLVGYLGVLNCLCRDSPPKLMIRTQAGG